MATMPGVEPCGLRLMLYEIVRGFPCELIIIHPLADPKTNRGTLRLISLPHMSLAYAIRLHSECLANSTERARPPSFHASLSPPTANSALNPLEDYAITRAVPSRRSGRLQDATRYKKSFTTSGRPGVSSARHRYSVTDRDVVRPLGRFAGRRSLPNDSSL